MDLEELSQVRSQHHNLIRFVPLPQHIRNQRTCHADLMQVNLEINNERTDLIQDIRLFYNSSVPLPVLEVSSSVPAWQMIEYKNSHTKAINARARQLATRFHLRLKGISTPS